MSEYQAGYNSLQFAAEEICKCERIRDARRIMNKWVLQYEQDAAVRERIISRPIVQPVEFVFEEERPLIRPIDILGCAAFLAAVYVLIIGLWAVTPAGSW